MLLQLIELVGVVQAHGAAKDALDESSNKLFILDPTLEIHWGLV
jgi:hypothetical protein